MQQSDEKVYVAMRLSEVIKQCRCGAVEIKACKYEN